MRENAKPLENWLRSCYEYQLGELLRGAPATLGPKIKALRCFRAAGQHPFRMSQVLWLALFTCWCRRPYADDLSSRPDTKCSHTIVSPLCTKHACSLRSHRGAHRFPKLTRYYTFPSCFDLCTRQELKCYTCLKLRSGRQNVKGGTRNHLELNPRVGPRL